MTYSGQYGVKDRFVSEFVDGLVQIYQEYQLPQNIDKDDFQSDAIETQFGLHFVLASKGDDFDRPSCQFSEEDPDNPEYSDGVENANDEPSLEQMQLYAQYRFYSNVFDLSDTTIEETYGITIPDLPTAVVDALDFYMGTALDNFYVFGTLNVNVTNKLQTGEFFPNSYTTLTNSELMAMLEGVGTVYYESVFADYLD